MVAWQIARCASREDSIEAGLRALLQPVSSIAAHAAVPAGRDPLPDSRFADVDGFPIDGMSQARRAAGGSQGPSSNIAVYRDSHDADHGRISGHCGANSPESVPMAHIIEVYGELTSHQDLCHACAPTEALAKLVRMADCEFDAALIGSFVRAIGPYPLGSVVRLGSGKLGWVIGRGPGAGLNPRVRVFFDDRSRERVAPCDLSLDTTASDCNGDSIVAYESPRRWQPRLRDFM
jgi:hypothetical protein